MPGFLPSREEIIRDLIKWFATEHGLDLAESVFASWSPERLAETWKNLRRKSSSGSGALLLLLLFVFASSKGNRR